MRLLVLMHDQSANITLLSATAVFRGISKKDLESSLRNQIFEVSFQTGDEINSPNARSGVFVLTEGSARILGAGDQPVSLELIKSGAPVGWFSLATRTPGEWVRAASPMKALRIPADVFEKLLKDFSLICLFF